MDGNGPGQSQGQLVELALHLRLYLAGLGVELILGILPCQRLHFYHLAVTRTEHADPALADLNDLADAAVEVTVFTCGIVLHEHHLCPLLQCQPVTRRIGVVREVALDLCLKGVVAAWQFQEFPLVVTVCQVVVGCQADISLASLGGEAWHTSFI